VGNYVSELLQAIGSSQDHIEIVIYEDPKNPLEYVKGDRIRKVSAGAKRYSLKEQFDLARRCRVDCLDVFHSPFYVTPWFAPCPVVVTIHDLIPFLFKIYSSPKQAMIKFGYRMAILKAERVIADSENTASDLQGLLGVPREKIRVVHLATSRDNFHERPATGELEYLFAQYGVRQPYVMTLSAKNWGTKNLSVVLQAVANCRSQIRSNFQTVIVGPSDGFQEASRRNAAELENVVLTGFVPTADLAKLYRGAQVFVIGSKYEGFGLPVLEAMSCGCAVVCSNGGSLAEVAGDGAILVDPEDAVEMGQAVARLFYNPTERLGQQARAKKRAGDFSWAEAARQTVSVYAEVAKQRRTINARHLF
jgi:glycosyltransferase involved in cell wall biosynthesis